jgi:hypothetical protein
VVVVVDIASLCRLLWCVVGVVTVMVMLIVVILSFDFIFLWHGCDHFGCFDGRYDSGCVVCIESNAGYINNYNYGDDNNNNNNKLKAVT